MKVSEKIYQRQIEDWKPKKNNSWPAEKIIKVGRNNLEVDDFKKDIKSYVKGRKWTFPKYPVHFISDIHADADAFIMSLVGAKMIKKTGIKDSDFKILEKAKKGKLIIGGDCFDKGPSNLRVLDFIKLLKDAGMQIDVLAGNHDVRTYAGIAISEDKRVVAEHMFVRMGHKSIPLFWEIYKKYLHDKRDKLNLLSNKDAEARLFPSKQWFKIYEANMEGLVPPQKIAKEVNRITEKVKEIKDYLKKADFSIAELYATVEKAREIFVDPSGEYGWFFDEMKVAVQEGSFLFVHAGLDDFSTDWIALEGTEGLNRRFQILKRNDPFELYHGHIGNIFRTKYRDIDFPFTRQSAKKLEKMRIHAIVHGHRNTTRGHRVTIKRKVLNFECDTTLDRHTRRKEGIKGIGAAWFTLKPNGKVEAYSTDYPSVKVFDVDKLGGKLSNKLPAIASIKTGEEDLKMKKKAKISEEFIDNRESIEAILKGLANDIESGIIKIGSDQNTFVSEIPENVRVEIKGEKDQKSGKLKFELTWG